MLTVVLSGADFATPARKEDRLGARGLGTFCLDILTSDSPDNSPLLVNLKKYNSFDNVLQNCALISLGRQMMKNVFNHGLYLFFLRQCISRTDFGWAGPGPRYKLFILAKN